MRSAHSERASTIIWSVVSTAVSMWNNLPIHCSYCCHPHRCGLHQRGRKSSLVSSVQTSLGGAATKGSKLDNWRADDFSDQFALKPITKLKLLTSFTRRDLTHLVVSGHRKVEARRNFVSSMFQCGPYLGRVGAAIVVPQIDRCRYQLPNVLRERRAANSLTPGDPNSSSRCTRTYIRRSEVTAGRTRVVASGPDSPTGSPRRNWRWRDRPAYSRESLSRPSSRPSDALRVRDRFAYRR